MPETKMTYNYHNGATLRATVHNEGMLTLGLQYGKECIRIEMPHYEIIKFVEFILPDYVELVGNNGPKATVITIDCERNCPYKKKDLVSQYDMAAIILDATLHVTGASLEKMKSSVKIKKIALARALFFYLARRHTTLSYPLLGSMMKKNHATVILAERRITEQRESDPAIDRIVRKIELQMQNIKKESNHGKEESEESENQ